MNRQDRLGLMETALATIGQGVAMFGRDRRLVYWNPQFVGLLDIAGPVDDWTHPHLLRHLSSRFITLAGGRELIRPDGRVLELTEAQPADGSLVLTVADITARKQVEEALREKENTLARGHRLALMGSWDYDTGTGLLSLSPEHWSMFGLAGTPREEVLPLGEFGLRFVHPDDQMALAGHAAHAVLHVDDPGYSLEFEYRAVIGGAVRWMAVTAAGKPGHPGVVSGVTQDITDRKAMMTALEETQTQLRAIIDTSPLPLLITALDSGRVHYANERSRALLQTGLGDLTALTSWSFYADGEDRRRLVRLVREHGQVSGFEAAMVSAQGRRFWGQISAVLIDYDGERCLFAAAQDITRARREAEELRAAKEAAEAAARARAQFLAMMSHEIRTPMNGVLGMVKLLLDTALTAEQRDYVDTIQYSGDSLLTILDDILDFSKLESGRLSLETVAFDLVPMARSVVDLLAPQAEEKGLALSLHLPAALPGPVLGDPTRVRQVLLNLVSNAVKFTDQGSIRVVVESAGNLHLWRFVVQDTGIGIPDWAKPKLFSEFAQVDSSITRRFGGTGLGLSICRRLVQMMGGSLAVESEEGRGSQFSFTIPLRPAVVAMMAPAPVTSPAEVLAERSLAILLAEDNLVNQKVALGFLKKLGHRITVAQDGFEAVAAITDNPPGTFDLVLMDVQMPGLDGLEATQRIRALPGERGRIPIVALTANALKGDDDKCRAAGMDDYMAKPVNLNTLREVLGRAV